MPPKSGFSRTRNIDYDDDDIYDDDDDYSEDGNGCADGLAEEDKEQMRLGTIRVREALADHSEFVSDAQIQDALWHYYYDVAKSAGYLKNGLGTGVKQATPKKEKTTSRFDEAAGAADQKAPTATGKQIYTKPCATSDIVYPMTYHPSLPPTSMPLQMAATEDFFGDVPWGNVPAHRLGLITSCSPRHKGGLLGGSSKLAALAAKRRKERENAESTQAPAKGDINADAAIAMLDQLSVTGKDAPIDSSRQGDETRPTRSRYPIRRKSRSRSQPSEAPEKPSPEEPAQCQPAIIIDSPAQRASASIFASTLCGPNQSPAQWQMLPQEFQATHASYNDGNDTTPFAGPSPDDIVRAAQAKGAGGGRY